MRRVARFTRLSVVLLAFLLPGFAQGQYVGVPGPGLVASSRQASLTGWFHVIWEDPLTDSDAEPAIRYVLIDDRGEWTDLVLDENLVRPVGGPLVFNRKRVKIVGESANELPLASQVQPESNPPVRVWSIELEQSEDTQAAAPDEAALPAVTGSKPWVTILCRFADSTNVTPHPKSWYETLMGSFYPGMDHYWREVSYEAINLSGSVVASWYNLPQPRSYYVYDRDGDGDEDTDWQRAMVDCTAVADADVFFPNFSGINLMFNQNLACDGRNCANGGSTTLIKNGQTKSYGITWMPAEYQRPGTLGHEMGHTFGLPHSSGPYGQIYDSYWDVMSGPGTCSPPHPQYGCVGVHTISYHKDLLGWIPPVWKYVATPGSSQTITIERLSQPTSGSNYLMAQIPISDSTTQFYTIEARRFAGYDDHVPGEAIVIHRVDTTTLVNLNTPGARVVDVDNNGDPNDAGAMWTPGETFTDLTNGTTVSVNAATPTGFVVTITSQPPNITHYGLGGDGKIYRWGGSGWTQITNAGGRDHFHFVSENEIYVLGGNGRIYKWNGSSFEGPLTDSALGNYFYVR